MRNRILLALIFAIVSLKVQAQLSQEQIKKDWMGKTWKIVQYETFGVSEDPSPEQLQDNIQVNQDMTFTIVENGKSLKGKWRLQSVYLTCTAEGSTWSKTYKIISIENQKSILEYKDPDLTKTLYYLELESN